MGPSEDDAVHKIPKWKCIGRISRKCQCRPFQMWAWSCITSYPLRGLPYLAYDNVNPAMVNSVMLHSSMHDLKRSIGLIQNPLQNLIQKDVIGLLAQCPFNNNLECLQNYWRSGRTYSKIRSVIFCVTKLGYKNCLLECHLPIIMLVLLYSFAVNINLAI